MSVAIITGASSGLGRAYNGITIENITNNKKPRPSFEKWAGVFFH